MSCELVRSLLGTQRYLLIKSFIPLFSDTVPSLNDYWESTFLFVWDCGALRPLVVLRQVQLHLFTYLLLFHTALVSLWCTAGTCAADQINRWLISWSVVLLNRKFNPYFAFSLSHNKRDAAYVRGSPIMLWLIIGRPIIGAKEFADYRPITDCLIQDASSFNKSHIVTIVKSQWYDRRSVTLLP